MGKRHSLQQMVLENWTEIWKRMKLDHFLTKHMKINPKWIRDINAERETIKILEENTGSNFLTLAKEKFSRYISCDKGNKSKTKLLGLHPNKKLLHS